jgi:hypothetical protein
MVWTNDHDDHYHWKVGGRGWTLETGRSRFYTVAVLRAVAIAARAALW